MAFKFKWISSPIGNLKLMATDKGLAAILWENDERYGERFQPVAAAPSHPILLETEGQLGQYFRRERRSFTIPLDVSGTDFQREIWTALLRIPFGQTKSYSEVAVEIGKPRAVRAVGGAANRNPIAIVIPCHRVIGASGQLTGFAGDINAKRHLLGLECGPLPKSRLDAVPILRPNPTAASV